MSFATKNEFFPDPCIDFFLNIKHMSYVSSGNKRIFYVEFVSMKKIISFFLWFFVFGCFYSDFRHFIKNGKNVNVVGTKSSNTGINKNADV